MGNSGSTVQEPEPQAQPVEDQFEVSVFLSHLIIYYYYLLFK